MNGFTHGTILTYISSLKQVFKLYNLCYLPFEHEWVRLALRSIARNEVAPVKVKGTFSVENIYNIVSICDTIPEGLIYKCVFLTALFGFLRLSNLVPVSPLKFNILEHLARGDIFFSQTHCTVLVKWSKTLQKSTQFATVQLPILNNSPLCPVAALQLMYHRYPGGKNIPLFSYPQGTSLITLTQSKVRKCLKNIVLSLGLSPDTYPFHTFRRTGASLAFHNSSSIQSIQQQGTWSSEAVWAYIVQDPSHSNEVTSTFVKMFAT